MNIEEKVELERKEYYENKFHDIKDLHLKPRKRVFNRFAVLWYTGLTVVVFGSLVMPGIIGVHTFEYFSRGLKGILTAFIVALFPMPIVWFAFYRIKKDSWEVSEKGIEISCKGYSGFVPWDNVEKLYMKAFGVTLRLKEPHIKTDMRFISQNDMDILYEAFYDRFVEKPKLPE